MTIFIKNKEENTFQVILIILGIFLFLFGIIFTIIKISDNNKPENDLVLNSYTDPSFKCPKDYESLELEEEGMIKFKENYFENNPNSNIEDFENYKKYMMEISYCTPEVKNEDIEINEDIEKNNIEEVKKEDPKTMADIVNEWKTRTTFVYCAWPNIFTKELITGRGSGTLNYFNDFGYGIMTNKHVLFNNGLMPKVCYVFFPFDKEFEIYSSSNNIIGGNNEDYGYIKLPDDDSFLSKFNKESVKTCNLESVNIGDEVIILGFPSIGSNYGITATNGIISGIEPNYFITSAKIDGGNSGGTAILVKDNCYLGIPSNAMVGKIESMGRILKYDFFIK